ncbi:MAG: SUMF1/EgtB/PvdO family nonheme iron enzyme [Deltaproteobacteria bacterium]|nr:SUMF1/EgtB/PvdO family nonheme iron enzyme [Deltaproteobacteria bacterium]
MYMYVYPLVLASAFVFSRCDVRLPKPCGNIPSDMKCVRGGFFTMGSDHKNRNQKPSHMVYVDTFFMDTTEVTAQAYDSCVAAKKCPYQKTWYKGYSGPKQPKVGLSWNAANIYCRAHGKRLPTEAEWELAARGYDGDIYPWGNDPVSCKHAVIMDARGRGCGRKGFKPGKGVTWDVGSKAPGRFGLYDMIGNADEYVHDWYAVNYRQCGRNCRGINPKGPCEGRKRCSGHEKVVKGGSWYWGASHNYSSYRRSQNTRNSNPYHHFGFRCAADSSTKIDKLIIIMNDLLLAVFTRMGISDKKFYR